jgi:hypothetical protein
LNVSGGSTPQREPARWSARCTTAPASAFDHVIQVGADQVHVLFTRTDTTRQGTNTIRFAKLDGTETSTPFTVSDTNLTEPVWSPCLP